MGDYNCILKFWFPDSTTIPKFWFDKNKETDQYIKTHYTDLLIKAENHQLNYWKTTSHGHLALIILLDQFSRHIYRGDQINMYKNDIIAYHHTKEFFLENKDGDLDTLETMMALMPFRHQIDLDSYEFVINYIKDKSDPIWDNFKHHTMVNYKYLKEHNNLPNRPVSSDKFINYNKFNSILEKPWSPKNQKYNFNSPLIDTLPKYINNNIIDKQNNIIIVSLSGGVDSMVILFILSQLKKFNDNLLLVAIHIDYHNRPETGLEAEFLFNYCSFMNIPLYYRYISEGIRKRGSKYREEYEELTKQIRFDVYKKVREIYKSYNFMGVILGHHKGDLQENIFQNVMKGRTLVDLSVIKESSEILGVKILRLLISHPKSDIFDMAEKNNIPYFKNTTPLWSNRGQYREIIQPAIIKTFGGGVLTNLSKLGSESDDLCIMIKTNIIDPYMKTIQIKDTIHSLPIVPSQPFTFWKYIIHEWCHQNKLPVISHKLVQHIYEKLYSKGPIKITCNSHISLLIKDNFINIEILHI